MQHARDFEMENKHLRANPICMGRTSAFFACAVVFTLWLCGTPARARHQDHAVRIGASIMDDPQLSAGFRLLYQLKFEEARKRFDDWENEHPAEPLGPALEGASDLFEEFYRKGVLTSEFFLDDKRLFGGITDAPDAALEAQFASAVQRADKLSRDRLAMNPQDTDAVFALTLIEGLQADDLFLIQKRQIESLHHLRAADRYARTLLQLAPEADDAYVALGAANYIIGCLPAYKRALLWVDRVHGDKALGMKQLSRAASSEHAHYLRPYAQLMLALAALRERNMELTRQQLQALVAEFPENPLFAKELAKVTPVMSGATPYRDGGR
jgi:hypothetical protein